MASKISRDDMLGELKLAVKAYRSLMRNASVYEDVEEDYRTLFDKKSASIEVILGIKINLEEYLKRYLNLNEERARIKLLEDLYYKFFGNIDLPKNFRRAIDSMEQHDYDSRDKVVKRLSDKISVLEDVLSEITKSKERKP